MRARKARLRLRDRGQRVRARRVAEDVEKGRANRESTRKVKPMTMARVSARSAPRRAMQRGGGAPTRVGRVARSLRGLRRAFSGDRSHASAADSNGDPAGEPARRRVPAAGRTHAYSDIMLLDVNGSAAMSLSVRSPAFRAVESSATGRTVYKVGRSRHHQGAIFLTFAHRRSDATSASDDERDDDYDPEDADDERPLERQLQTHSESDSDSSSELTHSFRFDWDNKVVFRLQQWEIGELADFHPAETDFSSRHHPVDGERKELRVDPGNDGLSMVFNASSRAHIHTHVSTFSSSCHDPLIPSTRLPKATPLSVLYAATDDFMVQISKGEMKFLSLWLRSCIAHLTGLDVVMGAEPIVHEEENEAEQQEQEQHQKARRRRHRNFDSKAAVA